MPRARSDTDCYSPYLLVESAVHTAEMLLLLKYEQLQALCQRGSPRSRPVIS